MKNGQLSELHTKYRGQRTHAQPQPPKKDRFLLGKKILLMKMDVSENSGFSSKSSICSQGFPLFSPSILG